ncbi:hypothetical protein [Pseudorhodoferax sp.]|uniref:hypothetical protein n=1 Tax=Pseudorhodoferax sp. TaxID=1993553 RepID=UPI0039E34402
MPSAAEFHDALSAGLQQRAERPDSRQQQQDNGTREFQPPRQQGDDAARDDARHTLSAYLERCRQRGELPRPAAQRPRPALRLAR